MHCKLTKNRTYHSCFSGGSYIISHNSLEDNVKQNVCYFSTQHTSYMSLAE
jgi:hypothetical protein